MKMLLNDRILSNSQSIDSLSQVNKKLLSKKMKFIQKYNIIIGNLKNIDYLE